VDEAPAPSSRSIRPAPPAFRAEVVSPRARAPHRKRMATATRAAPESRPASFRNLDDCTVDFAERRRGDPGVGGGHKTKANAAPQTIVFMIMRAFPWVQAKSERAPMSSGIGMARRYHPAREKQSANSCFLVVSSVLRPEVRSYLRTASWRPAPRSPRYRPHGRRRVTGRCADH